VLSYNDARRVLQDKQIMKPEVVAEAAHLLEQITLAGMIAFAAALPQNPYRLRPTISLQRRA
jgi:hypothetical protein